MDTEINQMITNLLPLARQAGEVIMEVYRQGIEADEKPDGSFVTQADLRAEAVILGGLRDLAADIPIISEENADSHQLEPPERFFLVDPLDGTAEFVKADGRGAFTVNIALVDQGVPVAGIIYAPSRDELYWGTVGQGAFFNGLPIGARQPQVDALIALASRSHRDQQTNDWITGNGIADTVSIGSSLKFCLIARGEADVYPRFGPTMEWDTAAGNAILSAAGGCVRHPDGSDFTYGKPGYRNGPFIARGLL